MRSLQESRVLITGAASGLGRTMADRFAAQGAEVVLTDIDEVRLRRAVDELHAAGSPARGYRMDVTDRASVAEVRHQLREEAGPIDVLVNNAGLVFGGYFLDVPLEAHLTTYRVNLLGLVRVTHAFLPDLIARPEGHLVNIASVAAYGGAVGGSTYGSSKWGVVGFSESIELEMAKLGHRHVHVTTVCPGVISTGLFEGTAPLRLTHILTPEQVADRVVQGVLRDRAYVRTPFLASLAPFLRGVLPHRAFNAVNAMLGGTSSMDAWTGRVGAKQASTAAGVESP
jgi:all-trans-retinol dehydrogenase (NAD+)